MPDIIFTGVGSFTGGNGISYNSGSAPRRLSTVNGIPPFSITRAIPRSPDNLIIYGNTVNSADVGERTANLFDPAWIADTTQISRDDAAFSLAGYACETMFTLAEFCSRLGLVEGDTITISRKYKNKTGSVAGRMTFSGFPTSQAVIREGKLISVWTIPEEALTSNARLVMYGNNSSTSFTIYNIMIVKGSYTAETMPAYEPYGYKIPCTVIAADESEQHTRDLYTRRQIHSGESLSAGADALPTLFKGTNTISIDTAVPPSGISISYYSR